jgi:hypothetical protein
MVAPPHTMVPGATEQDYYANKVTGAVLDQQPEQQTNASSGEDVEQAS